MIATVVWKEYREHRTIWAVLAVLAVGVVVGLDQFLGFQRASAPGVPNGVALAALAVTATCGLVCGALMLAGELEGGTLPFLDGLPALRRHVWAAKVLAGVALTLPLALLLAGVLIGLDVPLGLQAPANWAWILPAVVVEAFAWGLVGSAVCESVLSSVVLATILLGAVWLVLTPPQSDQGMAILVPRGAVLLAALLGSLLIFARSDWQRSTGLARPQPTWTPSRSRVSSWQAILWLTVRQGRGTLLILSAVGFLLGLLLPVYGLLFWPAATLLIGVLCGSTVFLSEQATGAYRFLGEQRFPMGRVWALKTIFWLLAACGGAVLVLLGSALYASIASTSSLGQNRGENSWQITVQGLHWLSEGGNLATAIVLWLLYGFTIGHICALVWRKSAVAVVVALLLSVAATTLWVPSLLAGSLPVYVVLVVPVLLLTASFLVQRAWVSGRLFTLRPVAVLLLGCVLALAWSAAALAYRVLAVPAVGPPFDVAQFVADFPTPEENESGRLIRQALHEMQERAGQGSEPAGVPGGGGMPGAQAAVGAPASVQVLTAEHGTELEQVIERGWSPDEPAGLGQWLDRLCTGDWVTHLRAGTALPPGLLLDPRQRGIFMHMEDLVPYRTAALVLTARALQLQARGEDRAALEHLTVVLALSRHLRTRSEMFTWLTGTSVESVGLDGLGHWMERGHDHPELVRQALEEMDRHERLTPPPTEVVQAEYLAVQNQVADPAQLLRLYDSARWPAPLRLFGEVVQTSWEAPWEKERRQRLLNVAFAGWLRGAEADYATVAQAWSAEASLRYPNLLDGWLPAPSGPATGLSTKQLDRLLWQSWLRDLLPPMQFVYRNTAVSRCRVAGTRLQLALLLYELDNGKAAPSLEVLVPRYLEELPRDPYSGYSFRYRISPGEHILWSPETLNEPRGRSIPAGQGIVWSVGPDLVDNGGTKQARRVPRPDWGPGNPGDIIFVVPLAGKPPG